MSKFLECIGVGKTYPGKTEPVEALRGIDFACEAGDFVCLLGRSGCGKSTLLQIVAGLERASAGQIVVASRELDGPSPDAAIVFQDHGLFPWMTVQRNVEFNMKARGTPAAERAKIAGRFIDMTGLTGFADRYPHELSGGMRQRVGIARALTTGPKALLMDEPFGALDAETRAKLQDELLQIWERQRTTVLFVTHSIDEALLLADRILVFTPRPGRIAADIKVDLPRPRASQSAAFTALAGELRGLIGADRDFD
ncbi:MAG: ABC transporter ATP-binding protein [Reyranella sp.]|jgi:ABC-type nitrate/sulfonate/bicarbonate transport system ATPase subunit|nr:ABC transporter ATP-binding protein [Reyranella sp.]